MVTKNIAIAIDGPAAAGKSTVAKKVAKKLGYVYIDTGAMYRSLTYKALKNEIDLENEDQLSQVLNKSTIHLEQSEEEQKVYLDGQDVTEEIRTDAVTNNVSIVAKHSIIRKEMVKRQQELAKQRKVVMDGRDIGTHVIPDAEVKIFLIASVEERAVRRHRENLEKGYPSELEKLKQEIEKRDQLDSEREASPLIKATDAFEIDTTSLSIDDVVNRILQVVSKVRETEK
ncbi:(d)CMP kinase [Aquibacillus koreensis]|uniref:Cytidylate kinase n=1 Tax=Aquibacillus koreensis TaxID=279446 RepID=A0A9X3WHS5_9BACI|nr:(d)CMP kinase [Aquibacillus koreensis]MCT2537402.1 (d)CMP kinase [Aquibacillus koreensis]MDC3418848.1 (d)CMP kinase [Aquibacillus koreensis]